MLGHSLILFAAILPVVLSIFPIPQVSTGSPNGRSQWFTVCATANLPRQQHHNTLLIVLHRHRLSELTKRSQGSRRPVSELGLQW